MAKLAYRTRGNGLPHGKQKVYFCAHPDDYVLLEEVCRSVLERQDCSFWYDEAPREAYEEEEWLSQLSEMTLFVMPVTSRLLWQSNRALDVEFAYAMKRHIPVLPLMWESGLEEEYGKMCGDLQYLDRYKREDGAMRYEEKLTKYLSSVLVGDELAKKVRSAFDAYIFLSYRKKDRRKAQELMRLIHKNEFCRDVAIWYDEYLVPGESFNKAIEEALQKSDLFALAVTPNLLEDGNYVMQYEYPKAKLAGKEILPAELEGTDRAELERKYAEIPKCVNARNEELSVGLAERLKALAIAENDDSPEHNYFIGLAYLKGIDVEVDGERAERLLQKAAERDLPEAMETLESMYRNGDGVERNYRTAIAWRERLAAHWRKVYEREGTHDSYEKLFSALWNLGDDWQALYGLSEAEAAYVEMSDLALAQREKNTPAWERDLAVSYGKLGDICEARNDLAGAEERYKQALAIIEELAASGAPEVQRSLAICYEKLGDVCEARNDLTGAEEYYLKGFSIKEEIAASGAPQAKRGLAVSYHNLGIVSERRGDFAVAEGYFRQEFLIFEELAESGSAQAMRDLSEIYRDLGDVRKARGDLLRAKRYYDRARMILETIDGDDAE